MFFDVYKAELYKITSSYRFKIVLLVILIFSAYNIVNVYKKFPKYDSIYEKNKKSYSTTINEKARELYNITNKINMEPYQHDSLRKIDEYIFKCDLEFYKTHYIVAPKKDFSEGLNKGFFNDTVWIPLMLLFCADIVCVEKLRNITKVQFATTTSRFQLYNAKYMALASGMLLIFFINLIFSFVFSGFLMGFSDLSGSMRSILDYSMSTREMDIREMFLIKFISVVLIILSASALFLLVSTLVQDVVTSYIISVLIVTNSWSFYNALGNGMGAFRYFFISFYSGWEVYFWGNPIYSIKFAAWALIFQSILVYFIGYCFYKRIQ